MKIKTITCHDVYNYGASLQAYALMSYLKQLGHEVEIIDYKPDYLSNHYKLTVVNPVYDKPIIKQLYLLAKLIPHLRSLKRKRLFDTFKHNYLKITSIRYANNDELKKIYQTLIYTSLEVIKFGIPCSIMGKILLFIWILLRKIN